MESKNFVLPIRAMVILFLAFHGPLALTLHAQGDAKQLVTDLLASWPVLSNNIQVSNLESTTVGGVRTATGMVTAFGQTTTMKVDFKGIEVRRVMMSFPPGTSLSTDLFRQLTGKEAGQVLPAGLEAKIGLKYFEINFNDLKKLEHVKIVAGLGIWAPFPGNSTVKISDIEGVFGIKDPISSTPNLDLGLKGNLVLPASLAKNMGIGATGLMVEGTVNTLTQSFTLAAALSSEEIPIVTDKSLVMKKAQVEFYYGNEKPGLRLRGQVRVSPVGKNPILLNGLLSIDITGTVYGEAWMDQKTHWRNPFGLSEKVYITEAGLGFGINFSTTPVPTPIMAFEAGISIKNEENAPPRFSGNATLGLDAGNPTRNMMDAEVGPLHLSDFVAAFSNKGVPTIFRNTLQQIRFDKMHFTVVPPGPGVKLFGIDYKPGIYAEGIFNFGEFTGAMFVDVKPNNVEVFGGMTPIRYPGFSLTGTTSLGGPYAYLSLKPENRQCIMALQGKLKVLGLETEANIYMSDAGFNTTVRGKIMGGFTANLDVAGTDLLKGGSIYVKASMHDSDNLVQKINEVASNHIGQIANSIQTDLNNYTAQIERLRPQLDLITKKLEDTKAEVRKDLERQCASKNQNQNQYRSATPLNSTVCPGDARQIEGYCYTCPSGFTWNGPFTPANTPNACMKTYYAKAERQGDWSVFDPCPSGQIGDIGGGCYSCPSGFLPTLHVIDINSDQRCNKVEYQSAVQGASIRCSGRSFADLFTGKCWECPEGYERSFSFDPVDGVNACVPIGSPLPAEICEVLTTEVINAHPRVVATFLEWSALSLQVNEYQQLVTALGQSFVDALSQASKWMVQHPGRAIVRINAASFEGCLSAVKDGQVAMSITGSFANQSFSGTFDLDLLNPEEGIIELANMLLATHKPIATKKNGSCTRPNVTAPIIEGTKIAEMISIVNRGNQLKERPKTEARPVWVAPDVRIPVRQ